MPQNDSSTISSADHPKDQSIKAPATPSTIAYNFSNNGVGRRSEELLVKKSVDSFEAVGDMEQGYGFHLLSGSGDTSKSSSPSLERVIPIEEEKNLEFLDVNLDESVPVRTPQPYQPLAHDDPETTLNPLHAKAFQQVYDMVKLRLPSRTEAVLWGVATSTYTLLVSAAAFYSLTEYSSAAIQEELADRGVPQVLLEAFEAVVKGASIVPMILSTNSARLLVSEIIDHYRGLGAQGMLESVPRVALKTAVPFTVAFISGFATGNVTSSRLLNDAHFPSFLFDWFCDMAMNSAITTNFRLGKKLFMDPAVSYVRQWGRPYCPERQALMSFLAHYSAYVDLLVSNDSPIAEAENPMQTALNQPAVSESLFEHFKKQRDVSLGQNSEPDGGALIQLFVNMIQNQELSGLPQNSAQSFNTRSILPLLGFVLLGVVGAVYTIPNWVSGSKAGSFAASKGAPLPGWLIGGCSFLINTLINAYSLWVLSTAVQNLLSNKKTQGRTWTDTGLDTLKVSLVLVYMVAQVGIVHAFPFEIDPRYDEDIATAQLAVTIPVAMGLALFSIDGAFQQLADFLLKYKYRNDLAQDGLTLSPEHIRVIKMYLNDMKAKLMEKMDAFSNEQVSSLFNVVNNALPVVPNGSHSTALVSIRDLHAEQHSQQANGPSCLTRLKEWLCCSRRLQPA